MINAGSSYLSASEPIAHFGVGAATTIDAIEVHWPGGAITQVPGPIAVDQLLQIGP
jgi:hypothetical protein